MHNVDPSSAMPISDIDQQAALRARIRAILTDSKLSSKDKNILVQELLTQGSATGRRTGPSHESTGADCCISSVDILREKSYHKDDVLGCKHYARQVRIVSPCCQQVFTCRLCHDEESDHNIDRHAIQSMICMHCNTLMPIGAVCSNSSCDRYEQNLAQYYCHHCKFFDDDDSKDIYHCEHCGLCRRGKGLEQDFRHCQACNACISMRVFDTHKCIERSLESNCPICHEFMFTSVEPVIFMTCGHAMHSDCFKRYTATDYTCPVCLKSIIDTRDHFEMFDSYVNSIEIPPEYKGMRAQLLCNDCLARTETDFHFYYHKCSSCSSFNTSVLSKWIPNGSTNPQQSSS